MGTRGVEIQIRNQTQIFLYRYTANLAHSEWVSAPPDSLPPGIQGPPGTVRSVSERTMGSFGGGFIYNCVLDSRRVLFEIFWERAASQQNRVWSRISLGETVDARRSKLQEAFLQRCFRIDVVEAEATETSVVHRAQARIVETEEGSSYIQERIRAVSLRLQDILKKVNEVADRDLVSRTFPTMNHFPREVVAKLTEMGEEYPLDLIRCVGGSHWRERLAEAHRCIRVRIVNLTGVSVNIRHKRNDMIFAEILTEGIWLELPDEFVLPRDCSEFAVQSDGMFKGTAGIIQYRFTPHGNCGRELHLIIEWKQPQYGQFWSDAKISVLLPSGHSTDPAIVKDLRRQARRRFRVYTNSTALNEKLLVVTLIDTDDLPGVWIRAARLLYRPCSDQIHHSLNQFGTTVVFGTQYFAPSLNCTERGLSLRGLFYTREPLRKPVSDQTSFVKSSSGVSLVSSEEGRMQVERGGPATRSGVRDVKTLRMLRGYITTSVGVTGNFIHFLKAHTCCSPEKVSRETGGRPEYDLSGASVTDRGLPHISTWKLPILTETFEDLNQPFSVRSFASSCSLMQSSDKWHSEICDGLGVPSGLLVVWQIGPEIFTRVWSMEDRLWLSPSLASGCGDPSTVLSSLVHVALPCYPKYLLPGDGAALYQVKVQSSAPQVQHSFVRVLKLLDSVLYEWMTLKLNRQFNTSGDEWIRYMKPPMTSLWIDPVEVMENKESGGERLRRVDGTGLAYLLHTRWQDVFGPLLGAESLPFLKHYEIASGFLASQDLGELSEALLVDLLSSGYDFLVRIGDRRAAYALARECGGHYLAQVIPTEKLYETQPSGVSDRATLKQPVVPVMGASSDTLQELRRQASSSVDQSSLASSDRQRTTQDKGDMSAESRVSSAKDSSFSERKATGRKEKWKDFKRTVTKTTTKLLHDQSSGGSGPQRADGGQRSHVQQGHDALQPDSRKM